MPLKIDTTSVNEGSTCKIEFTLEDYNGVAISVANISTAVFTLIDRRTGEVINSRTDVDVKSYFNTLGEFSYTLTADDNVIYNRNRKRKPEPFEEHIFCITITAVVSSESISLKENITIKVADLTYKT